MGVLSSSSTRHAAWGRRGALSRLPGGRGPANGRSWDRLGFGVGPRPIAPRPPPRLFDWPRSEVGHVGGLDVVGLYGWTLRGVGMRPRGVGGDGTNEGAPSSSASSMMLFSDFIASKSATSSPKKQKKTTVSDADMDALIERTSGVLQDAVDALQQVRAREARGVAGAGVPSKTKTSTSTSTSKSPSGRRPNFLSRGRGNDVDGLAGSSAPPQTTPATQSPNVSNPSPLLSASSSSIDGWFRGKVDAGPLMPRQAGPAAAPSPAMSSSPSLLKFKEREEMPSVLEFTSHLEAPEASVAAMNEVFPEHLALRFQSDVFSDVNAAEDVSFQASVQSSTQSTSTSGEEFGPNGYWYRWTEVSGQNEAGTVVWTERWWEVSDWSGMKELGAEKYGLNEHGDVWRETWTEKIVVEGRNKKPMVVRSAHKWARAAGGREWEEKWEEKYWSGGKTQKWADKWGREGNEVWHETWGEDYEGEGTDKCVKWTDRWAESEGNKWGDKWREDFQDGKGEKTGETWSEAVGQEKYQRWWGEKHMGEGRVQKFGNSTTGESWDVVEEMDTYYNPIPHFGYDLALSHSPQLHDVPTLPIDEEIIF